MIDLDGSQYPVKRLGDFARVSVLTSARGEFFRDVFESSLGSGGALGPGHDFFQGLSVHAAGKLLASRFLDLCP